MIKHLFGIFGVFFFLTACQPAADVNNGSNGAVAVDQGSGLADGSVIDERMLYAAEAAYNVPAHAYVQADATGKLSATVKAKAKPLLLNAYRALLLARQAHKVGDADTFTEQIAAVHNFTKQASDVIPK